MDTSRRSSLLLPIAGVALLGGLRGARAQASGPPPALDKPHIWHADQYAKSGRPVADAVAWGADPTGQSASNGHIQEAIDYMASNYTGGIVYLPPGTYKSLAPITIKQSVRLVGASRYATTINGNFNDVDVVNFDTTCTRGSGMEHIELLGFYNHASPGSISSNAVFVDQNVPCTMNDLTVFNGNAALYTKGIDGTYHNCWFSGCVSHVVSNGANWYERCILDGNGNFTSYTYAFQQGTPFGGATSQENTFVQSDFSGTYTDSINIGGQSTSPYTITRFFGCVTGGPIAITVAYWTSFVGHEFGSSSFSLGNPNGGSVSVTGSAGIGVSLTLSGGQFLKSANFNIT